MKVRKFYPRQALRRLQGEHQNLAAGQRAALLYVMRRGRKLGYSVSAGPATTSAELLQAATASQAEDMLANSAYRIVLRPSV